MRLWRSMMAFMLETDSANWPRQSHSHGGVAPNPPARASLRYTKRVPKILSNWSKEIVRRGVLRALGAYVIGVWLLAQGLVDLFPAVGLPDWAIQVFLVAALATTPLVCIVAWKYDLTLKGFLPDKQDVANRRRAATDATARALVAFKAPFVVGCCRCHDPVALAPIEICRCHDPVHLRQSR